MLPRTIPHSVQGFTMPSAESGSLGGAEGFKREQRDGKKKGGPEQAAQWTQEHEPSMLVDDTASDSATCISGRLAEVVWIGMHNDGFALDRIGFRAQRKAVHVQVHRR